MAFYAALSSLLDLLEDILHKNRYPYYLLGRQKVLKSLHQKFNHLLVSLQDYSSKGDEAADALERRIRDVAYEVQDIIESEIPKHENSEFGGNLAFKKIFHLLILACQNLLCPESEEDLQKVGREVDSIVEEVKAIKGSQRREDPLLDYDAAGIGASEQTRDGTITMVGFEEYLRAIQEQLCGPSSQLQAIPIVGMGGIGKTTLARNAFENVLIVHQFDFRAWVTISQEYDVIRVLQNIHKYLGITTKDELYGEEDAALEKHDGVEETLVEREREEESLDELEALLRKKEREVKELQEKLDLYGREDAAKEKHEGVEEALDEREREKEALNREIKRKVAEYREALDKRDALKRKKEEELEKRRKKKEIALKDHIHKYLTGRKYLFVVDDVWDTDVWDDLKHIFPDESKGSRVLITTRQTTVAEYAGTSDFRQQMQFLNPVASWNLLREKVFAKEHCPDELVDTGKFIASKCRGLPLAIVIIAGILSSVRTAEYWRMIARKVNSVLSIEDEQLSNILSLSYNHLPHGLKTCFLHMGSFPEDYEISISRLIKLWIAEGFLNSAASKSKNLERVGEEYLEDLVKRSLVIITKKRADGRFKACAIHDLLRDFCRKKAIDERFFHDEGGARHLDPSGAEKARRVILDSDAPSMPWAHNDGKYVRSICWFSKRASGNVHSLDWDSVKQLRVLDAANKETFVVPLAVSQMFHLKYLALQLLTKRTRHLPGTISEFQDLQTLIIYAPRCESISLPSEIWKMAQLRHLIIDKMILPPVPEFGDIPLQKLGYLQLQTLETVENFKFTNDAIQMIPNIRKLKLCCRGEEASGIWKLYCLDNLARLLQLEKLNISFAAAQFSYVDSFRNSFVFPQNLKKLSLKGCGLQWEELTVLGCLQHLQVLRLRENALVGEDWKPIEEQFLQLKFLLMESLNLKQWTANETHFPRLEHLKINHCRELKEIPLDIGGIPTLKFISVHDSKLAADSAEQILKVQREEYDNYELQLLGNGQVQQDLLTNDTESLDGYDPDDYHSNQDDYDQDDYDSNQDDYDQDDHDSNQDDYDQDD